MPFSRTFTNQRTKYGDDLIARCTSVSRSPSSRYLPSTTTAIATPLPKTRAGAPPRRVTTARCARTAKKKKKKG